MAATGNITDYLDANGTTVAHREYDAFGNTTASTGALVHELHFWFSTKYLDEETSLYYYGYRYLSPGLGRWLSRDPIEEDYVKLQEKLLTAGLPPSRAALKNSVHAYHFGYNDTLCQIDLLGKQPVQEQPKPIEGGVCCSAPCRLRVRLKNTLTTPIIIGGGCKRKMVGGWDITVSINLMGDESCYILGCKYWTCNSGLRRDNPVGWKKGNCDNWTHPIIGDPDRYPHDNYGPSGNSGGFFTA